MSPVVFDASFLIAATAPNTFPEGSAEFLKFNLLLRDLERQKARIVVPTPVLAEILVRRRAERARLIQFLQRSSRFELAEFGPAAAA
jgi:hypothetical protein